MKKKKNTNGRRRSDLIFVCVMLAFPIAHFCLMYFGVNINSILLAFKTYDINFDYVWSLNNFKAVFRNMASDASTWPGIRNAFILWFIQTVITLPTGMLVSFYFFKRYKFHGAMRIMYFIPGLLSSVVLITTFYILTDRVYPIIVEMLTGETTLGLMVNQETQLGAIIFYNIFYSLSGNFLLYSSLMSNVGEEVSEAAVIDGASPLQELWYVIIPAIFPTVSLLFVAGLPGILTNDFGLYGFYKQTGATYINLVGFEFTVNIAEHGQGVYPYYAAYGLILSVLSCIITFSGKALINRMDPFADADGSRKQKRRGGKK